MNMKNLSIAVALAVTVGVLASAQGPRRVALGDWPEARGPNRDGVSTETGLVEKWALNGQNFLWRAPYGGRSAPIVMGNRVYVQNPTGRGTTLQERVMALDADTGKLVWEYKFNIFQSDVPAASRRLGLARGRSGNRQHLRVQRRRAGHRPEQRRQAAVGPVDRRRVRRLHHARRPDDVAARRRRPGHRQRRDLELGHGGQPLASVRRARQADGRHRLRREPGRPSVRHGLRGARRSRRSTACGCSSPASATAAIHAIKPQTGEKVWSFVAAKRAINTGVVVKGHIGDRLARRREPRHERARHDRRDRRIADRRHQDDEVGGERRSVRVLVAGHRRRRASTRSRTARG